MIIQPTIEEIKEAYTEYHEIPCSNDHANFISDLIYDRLNYRDNQNNQLSIDSMINIISEHKEETI